MIPQWIKCFFMSSHDFFKIKSLSDQADMIGCKYCKKIFARNNHLEIFLNWDVDFQKFYMDMEKLK